MAQGNKGRFSERLKKIAFRKRKRINYPEDENSKIVYQNVLKVLAAIPGMVYSNVRIDEPKKTTEFINDNQNEKEKRISLITNIDINRIKEKQDIYFNVKKKSLNNNINKLETVDNVNSKVDRSLDKVNVNKNVDNVKGNVINDNEPRKVIISGIESNNFSKHTEENKPLEFENDFVNGIETEVDNSLKEDVENIQIEEVEHNKEVEKLEKDILDTIKKKLVVSINTLEILQSELYILSEVNGDAKTQEECEKQIKEIKELLKRIEKLKEQYDFLKDNYDFEYLMTIDDDNLVDKIIKLKDGFDNNQIRAFVKDYKLLDEYKYLYLKIDKIQDKTNELEEEKNKELEELKKRDIDFEKLKNKVYNVDAANDMYNNMIREQNEIIKKIDEDVAKINSYEQVDYHLKGLNKLMLNSFKYLGLLMLTPLKGVFPAIAVQTLMAKDMLKGVYRGLKWEEERRMVYSASNYDSSIEQALNNMDYVSNSIDETLSSLIKMKNVYNYKFKNYQNDHSEYKEIIDKINDMANKMMGNKIKVEIMKKRTLEQKKVNHKKLILVDKLNNEQKNGSN